MLIRTETVIDTSARMVSRRSLLFGHYPIRTHATKFAELRNVLLRHWHRSNSADDADTYWVFLQSRSNDTLLISYFQADEYRNCRQAEELANRLAADLNLEIVEQTW